MTAVRVYRYGLRPPDEGLEQLEQQARLAHRYRNTLIEIERGRRAALRDAEREDPRAAGVAAAILWLEALATLESSEIKALRARTRTRSETLVMRARRDDARRLAKRAKQGLRLYTAWWLRPNIRARLDTINDRARQLRCSARKFCGVYWGTYLLVEAAVHATSKMPLWEGGKPNDPRFIRWDGQAAWGVQLQGGLAVNDATSGADKRLRIEPLIAPPHMTGRRSGHRAILRLRVASNKRAPVWAAWRMTMHRPLPASATVKLVTVHRRREGRRWRWTVNIIVGMKPTTRRCSSRIVGIDFGWRRRPGGGIRVAYWSGSDGDHGELTLDAKEVDRFQDKLRSVRTNNLNAAREWICRRRGEHDAPTWFVEGTATAHAWRSPRRFAALCALSRRETGPQDIRLGLEWWRRRDIHLWDWETAQREKTVRRRQDLYRRWARYLATRYQRASVAKTYLRTLIKRPEDAPPNEMLQHHRSRAALSELRAALCDAFGEDLAVADAADATRRCHHCGHLSPRDSAHCLEHTCERCGESWDQDENAAIQLRQLLEQPVGQNVL